MKRNRLLQRWMMAAAAAAAWLAAAPAWAGPGEAVFAISVDGLAELHGRSPLVALEGDDGPPLSTWLAGYVISLLHETLAQALDAGDMGSAASPAWDRRIEYRIAHADARYVSLLFTDWLYGGGAHGNTTYHTFLWVRGPAGWREATLGDLLLPEGGPRQRLSEAVLAELRKADAGWVTGGSVVQLSEERLQAFTLSPAGLALHFAPYEVGPYAQGSFEVAIPVERLDGMVRPQMLAMLRQQ